MTEPPESSEKSALRAEFERRAERLRTMADHQRAYLELANLAAETGYFGAEVARLREQITGKLRDDGLSWQEIADLTNVDRSTVRDYSGRKRRQRQRKRDS